MVRIPSYQSQVTASPPRIPEQRIPDAPREAFGENVARAQGTISQVLDPIAGMFAKRAEEQRRIDNATYSANVSMMYMDAIQDRLFSEETEKYKENGTDVEKTRGLMLREKDKASGSVFEFDDFYQKEAPRYLDMIKDPSEKLRFQQMMMNDYQSKRNALIKNEVNQKHTYNVDSQMSAIDQYVQEFASVQNDEDLRQKLDILDGMSQTLYSDTQGMDFNRTQDSKMKDADRAMGAYLTGLTNQGRYDEALAKVDVAGDRVSGAALKTMIENERKRNTALAENERKQQILQNESGIINALSDKDISQFNETKVAQMIMQGAITREFGEAYIRVLQSTKNIDYNREIKDSGFTEFAHQIFKASDEGLRRKAIVDLLDGSSEGKMNREQLAVLLKTAQSFRGDKKESFIGSFLKNAMFGGVYFPVPESNRTSFRFFNKINNGTEPVQAKNEAIFEEGLYSNSELSAVKEGGTLMIDAMGNKAIVHPDGRVEEIR